MYSRSKVSTYKIKKILLYFSQDLTALETANRTRLNRNTINRYYKLFRQRLAAYCEQEKPSEEYIKSYEKHFEMRLNKTKIPAFLHNNLAAVSVYTNSYKVYTVINDNYKENLNIKHFDHAHGKNYTNEFFWVYCKIRLSKFYGIRPVDYYLHIKECEFRYNNRNEDLYKIMLKAIKLNR